jgi:DnaK suppressor protein
MTKAELQAFRNTLLTMRTRLTGDVSHLAGEAFRSRDDNNEAVSRASQDPAEQGSDQFEQEFTLSLLQNQEQVLEEIADALRRIDEGTFGTCEECQKAIPKPRLRAVPYARHCVACAREIQQCS